MYVIAIFDYRGLNEMVANHLYMMLYYSICIKKPPVRRYTKDNSVPCSLGFTGCHTRVPFCTIYIYLYGLVFA